MKKLKLSKFDLGVIIAFVVIGLLGGGAWYYLSGKLQDAQADVASAKSEFDKNSVSQKILVSRSNDKILRDDIDLLKTHIDPLVQAKLVPKENKLSSIDRQDPVAWKHQLDEEVRSLTAAAKLHGVKLPPKFYFSFSRYLSQGPGDESTTVLSKQLLAVEQIVTILTNAPVKEIQAIRRTYEEDPHSNNSNGGGVVGDSDKDHLGGYAVTVGGGLYVSYPYEIEFDATSENLRKIIDDLIQSPYVFVIRSLSIQNLQPTSPQLSYLDQIAGPTTPSVVGSDPGAVAATTSTKGPQYLFGNDYLHIKARIDLIEWKAGPPPAADASKGGPGAKNSQPGGQ